MHRDHPRARRVGEQIQRILAQLIRDKIKDPRLGMVTVSAVRVSRDLGQAKVFVTVLGDEQQREDSLHVLHKAAGFLRSELGREMTLRAVPQLCITYDESIEYGTRLSSLIDSAIADDAN
ncbi:MAG: 30S ribosome-binding factor RbfA [Gammaproteobacteria bacterium]